MAVTSVQSNHAEQTAAATSIGVALPGAITAGDNIVVAVTWNGSGTNTVTNVSDGTTTITTPDVTWKDTGNGQNIALYSFPAHAAGSPTFTATFNASTAFIGIDVAELTPSVLDQVALGISGSSTTPTARSLTPSVNGSFIVAMFDCAATITPTAPFSTLAVDNTLMFTIMEGFAQTVAAAIAAACSQATNAWGAIAASYKSSVVAAVVLPRSRVSMQQRRG